MFDPSEPGFLANPYPALNALRETAAILYDERLERWLVTRHADVRACLRDRRLGRNFRHVGTEAEFVASPLDPRWSAFWDVERWSLLWIEPPEHARIRTLVAAAFTPRSVEAVRAPARQLAHALLAPLVERARVFADPDRFDVGRANAADHIGFGGGIHSCIGAPLARIELEASLGSFVDQVGHLELAAEPRRTGNFVIWGLEELRLVSPTPSSPAHTRAAVRQP